MLLLPLSPQSFLCLFLPAQETQELQKKQQWYQQNQLNMTLEDEDAYLTYCSDAMFRIRILELRLSRYSKQFFIDELYEPPQWLRSTSESLQVCLPASSMLLAGTRVGGFSVVAPRPVELPP